MNITKIIKLSGSIISLSSFTIMMPMNRLARITGHLAPTQLAVSSITQGTLMPVAAQATSTTAQRAAGKVLFKLGHTSPTYQARMNAQLLKYCRTFEVDGCHQPNPIAHISNLLKNGAQVNATDPYGNTPLHLVVGEAYEEQLSERTHISTYPTGNLQQDADNAKSHAHQAVYVLEKIKEKQKAIELLLLKGANINAQNTSGETPLHCARRKEIVRTLISSVNIHLNVKDSRGRTPLHVLMIRGKDCIQPLLDKPETDVNAQDSHGRTPLHEVFNNNYSPYEAANIQDALLSRGAKINEKDNDGQTALHYLASRYTDAAGNARLLLQHGADVTLKDNQGRTALDLAHKHNNIKMVRLLEEHSNGTAHR